MSKKKFTEEQIDTLSSNPIVKRVSKSSIQFTSEFADTFIEKRNGGKNPDDIFAAAGIDPCVLGEARVRGYDYQVRKQYDKSGKYSDEVDEHSSEATSTTEAFDLKIGEKIRTVRRSRSITLKELSTQTGMSVGFLSNLERDLYSPTLENIQKICAALDISMLSLFEPVEQNKSVLRKDERSIIFLQAGEVLYESLDFDDAETSVLVITVLSKGSFKGDWEHSFDEIGYVLEGEMGITIDGIQYVLQKGDACYIKAGTSHSLITNPSNNPCSSLWIRPSSSDD